MANAEEAMAIALGYGADATKIVGWTNDEITGQLTLLYDGPEPVTAESITVLVTNINPDS